MILTLISYLLFVPHWNKSVMLAGVFRRTNANIPPPASYEVFLKKQELKGTLL